MTNNEAQDLYAEQVKNEVKAEAIKEFAEKLKAEYSTPDILMPFNWISIEDTALDELVAEMAAAEPDPEGQN